MTRATRAKGRKGRLANKVPDRLTYTWERLEQGLKPQPPKPQPKPGIFVLSIGGRPLTVGVGSRHNAPTNIEKRKTEMSTDKTSTSAGRDYIEYMDHRKFYVGDRIAYDLGGGERFGRIIEITEQGKCRVEPESHEAKNRLEGWPLHSGGMYLVARDHGVPGGSIICRMVGKRREALIEWAAEEEEPDPRGAQDRANRAHAARRVNRHLR